MLSIKQRLEVVEIIRGYEESVTRLAEKESQGEPTRGTRAIRAFSEALIEHFQPPMARLDIIRGEDISLD